MPRRRSDKGGLVKDEIPLQDEFEAIRELMRNPSPAAALGAIPIVSKAKKAKKLAGKADDIISKGKDIELQRKKADRLRKQEGMTSDAMEQLRQIKEDSF